MLKYLDTILIHTVLQRKTARFVVRNGPFDNAKRAVLQSKTAPLRKLLCIREQEVYSSLNICLNYIYILFVLFCTFYPPGIFCFPVCVGLSAHANATAVGLLLR